MPRQRAVAFLYFPLCRWGGTLERGAGLELLLRDTTSMYGPLCALYTGGPLVRWSRCAAGREDGTSRRTRTQPGSPAPPLTPWQGPLCRIQIAHTHSGPWPSPATFPSSPSIFLPSWISSGHFSSELFSSWWLDSRVLCSREGELGSFGLSMVEHLGSASSLPFCSMCSWRELFLGPVSWHQGPLGSISFADQVSLLLLTSSYSASRSLALGTVSSPALSIAPSGGCWVPSAAPPPLLTPGELALCVSR